MQRLKKVAVLGYCELIASDESQFSPDATKYPNMVDIEASNVYIFGYYMIIYKVCFEVPS
jgi:hypothetical protein